MSRFKPASAEEIARRITKQAPAKPVVKKPSAKKED